MASGGFHINERAIADMASEIQRAFDKHVIRVPLEGDPSGALPGAVTNYYGPVVQAIGDRTQIAWGNSNTQNQDGAQAVTAGYEEFAALVGEVRRRLVDAGHAREDQQEAEETADDLLRELTLPVPDETRVRKGARLLTGFLAPLLLHVSEAVATDWIKDAIERLQDIPT